MSRVDSQGETRIDRFARRWLWTLLALVAVVGASAHLAVHHADSWHFFAGAVHLIASPGSGGGLDLYRTHPELQFGPLAIVLSAPFVWLPAPIEEWAVMVAGSLAGVGALAMGVAAIARRHPDISRARWARVVLLAGPVFVLVWVHLAAAIAHVDDVIALTALTAAGWSIERRRPGWAVVALIVAAGTKPWAIVFAPVALLTGGRSRWNRLAVVVLVTAAFWLPFVFGSAGTLRSLRDFAVHVDANSGLRALGFLDATTPPWLRPVQLGLGLGLVAVAVVWRRSWPAALAVGIASRLLLDPTTHRYFDAGFVLAVGLWEIDRWPGRLPWRTASAAVVLEAAAAGLTIHGLMAPLRFVVLSAVIVVALRVPADHRPTSGPSPLLAGGADPQVAASQPTTRPPLTPRT